MCARVWQLGRHSVQSLARASLARMLQLWGSLLRLVHHSALCCLTGKEKNAIDFRSLASTAASTLTSSAAARLMLTSCIASFPGQRHSESAAQNDAEKCLKVEAGERSILT